MTEASDATNVRSWRPWRKIMTVVFVSSFSFFGTFAASIIAPGREKLQHELEISRTVSVLTFSLFNLGLAWGSIVGSPVSENYGRRAVYLVSVPALLIFVMACGFCHDLPSLLICRLLAGLFGSPGVTLASATISDMFEPGSARSVPLFCYYSMPWLGSVLGPLIGSVVVSDLPWEWTQWVFLFIAVPIVLPGLIFLPETKQSVIDERAGNDEKTSFRSRMRPKSLIDMMSSLARAIPAFLRSSLLRPLQMLFTELIVGLVCLYAGFNFGLIYALIVVFPDIFSDAYGFGVVGQDLAFLGLITGCFLGPACLVADSKLVDRQRAGLVERGKRGVDEKPSPETRLHGAMIGAVMLPAGLFWFAWTAQPGISFLSAIFASVLITCGALMIYVSTSAYVIDVYGPKFGASANGASSITRYTLAAAIPLFTLQMYDALGVAWATSLLGFCALLMMPIPFCFFRWGEVLRQRCKFQTER